VQRTEGPLDMARWFAGSTTVVTGGGRGIGLAIGRCFTRAGARVLLLDLDKAALDEAVAAHPEAGFATAAVDLADDACMSTVRDALTGLPPVKNWSNNAGIVSHASSDDVAIEEFERVQRKNATTVLIGAKLAREVMGSFDDHSIVNISSLAALRTMDRRIAYGVSKTAVLGMTNYLAHDWGRHRIRVNAICPGHISTRLTAFKPGTADGTFHEELLSRLPIARRGTPDDIAGAALFLSSPLATYVTGVTIPVDGGWHLA
jgi:NAD(P)-dependent dehydrogenase (short-subunit alcohol dehydrogenase family)